MKFKFLLFLLLAVSLGAYAQSHTYKASEGCKYGVAKPGIALNLEKFCPACRNEKVEEDKARKEYDVRQFNAAKAKAEEEKRVLAAEADAKQAKADAVKKVNISVEFPKTNVIAAKKPQSPPVKKAAVAIGKKFYMYQDVENSQREDNNYFLNDNGDTVLKSKDYLKVSGAENYNKGRNFPQNIGIVTFVKTKDIADKTYRILDLVNDKGVRYFNDDNITVIDHLIDDYFLIRYGKVDDWFSSAPLTSYAERAVIYNITTKKATEMEKSYPNQITVFAKENRSMNYSPYRAVGQYKSFVSSRLKDGLRVYYITNNGEIESDVLH